MNRSLRLFNLALCAALVLAPVAFAQTTGSISGMVTAQADGSALPGAQVTAVLETTGTRYTTISSADGRFRMLNVRVGGPYSVTVAMDGFHSQDAGDVFVQLGEDANLAFQLQLASIDETVIVVGESSPLINPSKTGSTSNVNQEAIESLPTISRGLEDFARTNPFFTVASENEDEEAISVAGRSSRYNNISIDGAVNNDLFGLSDSGTPGGQTRSTPISLDAIQELQLLLSPTDVRQGGFSGGGINAITRHGSNAWKGSVFYFTRDDSLVGDGPESLGEFGDFEDEEYGFRIGGPMAKDKAFFFFNIDIGEETQPTGWSIDGSGGQTFGGGQLTDEGNRFRDILINNYGYDPGGLGQNSRDTPSDKYFLRFDFNLSDQHNLTLRHNYIDSANDINRPSSQVFEFPSETYLFVDETNSTVAQLNSTVGNSAFNELRVSYQTIEDRREGKGLPRFPWIEIEDVDGSGQFEFEAGTEAFSTFNSLDQDVIEITNDFTWLKGNHTITVGTHNELFTFDNLFIQNGFGAYEFSDLDAFEAGTARRFRRTVPNPGQDPLATFDVEQIGLYVGDQWAARDNLTVTYGLRVDIPFFPDAPENNPEVQSVYGFRTDEIPDGNELWSPRIGFNWDIKSDGRQQLRGSIGQFAGRTPYVWISNQYSRNARVFSDLQASNVPFNPDPFNQPSTAEELGGFATSQEVNLIDPGFEFPTVLRANLGYDRELPWWGLIGSAELIYTESQKEIDYKNLNLEATGESLPFDGRPLYTTRPTDFSGAYLITNTSEGEATNASIKLERPFSKGLWGFVSYAWGESKEVNDGGSSRAVSNWQYNEVVDANNHRLSTSSFEVEHRFNASISYRINRNTKYSTTVSAFYNHQSGRPYSNILAGGFPFTSINGDGFTFNDLFYVPAGEGDVALRGGTWAQLDAYITAVGLDGYRGQIAPRNASVAPWSHSLDLRLAQDIPIKNSSLQLTFDIVNLGNMLDSDSGLLRFANFNTVTPARYDGVTSDGIPRYTLFGIVTDPENNARFQTHNLNSRWKMKLGVRWTF